MCAEIALARNHGSLIARFGHGPLFCQRQDVTELNTSLRSTKQQRYEQWWRTAVPRTKSRSDYGLTIVVCKTFVLKSQLHFEAVIKVILPNECSELWRFNYWHESVVDLVGLTMRKPLHTPLTIKPPRMLLLSSEKVDRSAAVLRGRAKNTGLRP